MLQKMDHYIHRLINNLHQIQYAVPNASEELADVKLLYTVMLCGESLMYWPTKKFRECKGCCLDMLSCILLKCCC